MDDRRMSREDFVLRMRHMIAGQLHMRLPEVATEKEFKSATVSAIPHLIFAIQDN